MKKQTLTYVILSALAAGTLCTSGTALAAEADDEATDLGETVVTAERIPTTAMSTPADVAVITAEDIEANHYADVAEALNHVPGVVMTNGASGNDQVVRINGEERVVVMVDGERLNDDQGSMSRASATLTRIPSMKDIERIEVVKGAGSALYGSDAVGGVVNIITKKAKENRTQIDLNTGSWKTHNYEIYNQGSDIGGLSWTIAAGIQKRGYFYYKDQQGDTTKMGGSDYSNNGMSLNLRQKLKGDNSIGLRFAHRTMDGGSPAYDRWGYYGPAGEFYSKNQQQIMNDVSVTYRFKEDTKLPGYLRYFNHYKANDFSGKFQTRLQGVDYQDGWRLDANNKIVAGAEWHRSDSSNKQSGYEGKNITTTALYLQDSMRLADKWIFVPGVRMDHHNEFGTHWSPKAALNYRPDRDTKIYASWGRVFKAPTADDLYYEDPWMHGNPNLDPETGHVETIGFSHAFGAGTSLDMSYFNSNLHDAIVWGADASGSWTPLNVYEEKKHGFTLSWKQQISKPWSYELGYTYTHTETPATNTSTTAEYVKHNSMPNGYRIGLHYAQGPWKANLEGRMGTGLDKTYYGDNRYTVFDFNTSYAATPQLTIYAKALNFTNEAYSRYAGWNYPAPGRFFQIGMTYTF